MLQFIWVIYMSESKKPHNRIAELRREKGLTLQQVGDAVGVGNNTISRYENGKREPNSEMWKKLANYFNVSVDYLVGNDDYNTFKDIEKYAKELRNKYAHGSIKVPLSDFEDLVEVILASNFLIEDILDQPHGVKKRDIKLTDNLYNIIKKINMFYTDDSTNPDNFRNEGEINDYVNKANEILITTLKELSKLKTKRYIGNNI